MYMVQQVNKLGKSDFPAEKAIDTLACGLRC